MRLFVAACDPAFASEVAERWDEVAAPAPFRRVRQDGLHATFAFLGEVEEPVLGRLAAAIDRAGRGVDAFSLTLDRVGALGNGHASRVWVLSGESEVYARLAGRIRRLLDFPLPARRRPTVPHVTLARSREVVRVEGRPITPPFGFEVREITLFESFLEPGGARYVARHTAALADGRP